MIVTCDNCGLKYKVDPSKMKGDSAKLTCKGCSFVITVNKPDLMEETPVIDDSAFSVGAEESKTTQAIFDPSATESAEPSTQAAPQGKMRSGLGLTTKVILLMLLVSLVPGAIYFAISTSQTNQRIIEETNRFGVQSVDIMTGNVDEWVDKNIRVLKTLAELPAMESMTKENQEPLLKAVQKEYPWMYLVHTINLNGMNVARSDGAELADYSGRQYVQDVKNGKALSWQNLIGQTSKKPALVVAVPIKNNDQVVGVLASAMSLETITKVVTGWRHGKTGQVFLVDQDGRVIVHQNEKYILEQKDLSKHPLVVAAQKKAMEMIEFKDADNKEMIGFSRKTQLQWTLALQQEKSEAFAALKKAQIFAVMLLVGTVVIIVFIAYFASKAIVTPIRKLTDAANRISVGELSVEIVKSSKDEIGELADAIIRMQDSIRLSIERLRRKKR